LPMPTLRHKPLPEHGLAGSVKEPSDLMCKLFQTHVASDGPLKGCLDLDRFVASQAALAKVQGLKANPTAAALAFNELASAVGPEPSIFRRFSQWQLRAFSASGLSAEALLDVLHRAVEEAKAAVQSLASEEKARRARFKAVAERRRDEAENATDVPGKVDDEAARRRRAAEQARRAADARQTAEVSSKAAGKASAVAVPAKEAATQPTRSLGYACASRFRATTRRASQAWAGNLEALAQELARETQGEEETAWAIYVWICHHVSYDSEGFEGKRPPRSCEPRDVLRDRVCVCAGYARLFEALAREASLRAEYVGGIARGSEQIGAAEKDVFSDSKNSHAWNAVQLGGKWFLLDCTWGAGSCQGGGSQGKKFVRKFNPHYFGVPPEQLAFSHFSSDWNLLNRALSKQEFVSQPYPTSEFFAAGMSFMPGEGPVGVVACRGSNTGVVQLMVPRSVGLLADLGGSDEERCFIERPASGDEVRVHFRCPRGVGSHDLKIYVRQSAHANSASYGLACTYQVAGHAGPTRFVEPCFPKVHSDAFEGHGFRFAAVPPEGLLKADQQGTVALPVLAPSRLQLLVTLNDEEVQIASNGDRGIVCSLKPRQVEGKLSLFAGEAGSTRLGCIATFKLARRGSPA